MNVQPVVFTIVVGVISGVLTAAFLYVCLQLLNRVFLPWYQGLIYKGVDVSGRWVHELQVTPALKQTVVYDLFQRAHKITGTSTVSNSASTGVIVLNVNGEIRDRLVLLRLVSPDRQRISLSTILLEVYGRGSAMRGYDTWYDAATGTIVSRPAVFGRASEI